MVFIHSDWSKRWPDPKLATEEKFPGVKLDALKFLHLQRHILMHGHEALDTDTTPDLEGEAWLLRNGYTQGEGICNLDQVPETGALVCIGYPKLGGGTGGYARYIAICPPEWKYGVTIDPAKESPLPKHGEAAALGRQAGHAGAVNTMRNLSVVLLVPLMAICALAARQKYDGRLLIGLWVQSHESRSAIILRRADGTYLEKFYQKYDFNEPPFYCESTGRWEIRGGHYITTVTSWSAPIFKETVGKTIKREVLSVDRQLFKYFSTDDAEEEEHRIGEASENGFHQTRLKLIAAGWGNA